MEDESSIVEELQDEVNQLEKSLADSIHALEALKDRYDTEKSRKEELTVDLEKSIEAFNHIETDNIELKEQVKYLVRQVIVLEDQVAENENESLVKYKENHNFDLTIFTKLKDQRKTLNTERETLMDNLREIAEESCDALLKADAEYEKLRALFPSVAFEPGDQKKDPYATPINPKRRVSVGMNFGGTPSSRFPMQPLKDHEETDSDENQETENEENENEQTENYYDENDNYEYDDGEYDDDENNDDDEEYDNDDDDEGENEDTYEEEEEENEEGGFYQDDDENLIEISEITNNSLIYGDGSFEEDPTIEQDS